MSLVGIGFVGTVTVPSIPQLLAQLELPAKGSEFLARPYSLITYWLFEPSIGHWMIVALLLGAYGAVLQPRISTRVLTRISAISVVAGGLFFVVLWDSGFMIGMGTIELGLTGAVLYVWATSRQGFALWEHVVTACAGLMAILELASVVFEPATLGGIGTVAIGAFCARLTHRSADAPDPC